MIRHKLHVFKSTSWVQFSNNYLQLTNLRPTTAKGPKKGPWDPFLKKVAKQDRFLCLDIPPFSTNQHFLFKFEKKLSERTEAFLVC